MDNIYLQIVVYSVVLILIFAYLVEIIYLRITHKKKEPVTTRIAATTIGLISGFVGGMHSWGEFSHRETQLTGFLFEANTGRSLINVPSSEWTGWVAFTLVPNFFVTAILSLIMSLIIITYVLFFCRRKTGSFVLILLSLISILFGCGFIPPFLGIIAGVISLQLKQK